MLSSDRLLLCDGDGDGGGPRLAPRDQRSGGDGCRAARGPFPSDPPPFFPPIQKDLKEEAGVWEVADVYTPLENQESMLKETKT